MVINAPDISRDTIISLQKAYSAWLQEHVIVYMRSHPTVAYKVKSIDSEVHDFTYFKPTPGAKRREVSSDDALKYVVGNERYI